jgi:hypothetical protein
MYKMRNLMQLFGLFLLLSTTYGSFNLYLNEHETMRLLGELSNNKLRTHWWYSPWGHSETCRAKHDNLTKISDYYTHSSYASR